MSKLSPSAFIEAYYSDALSNEKRYGVPAMVTLAQAALESGWGGSSLSAPPNYNFFGIKADSSWKGPFVVKSTREVINGRDVYINAKFRKYASAKGSFEDHAKFLRKFPRYANAFKTKDPYKFATEVARAGYATDPNYARVLHGLITRFEAMEFVRKYNPLQIYKDIVINKWVLAGLFVALCVLGGYLYLRKEHKLQLT